MTLTTKIKNPVKKKAKGLPETGYVLIRLDRFCLVFWRKRAALAPAAAANTGERQRLHALRLCCPTSVCACSGALPTPPPVCQRSWGDAAS